MRAIDLSYKFTPRKVILQKFQKKIFEDAAVKFVPFKEKQWLLSFFRNDPSMLTT
jgi:hypothetical protein